MGYAGLYALGRVPIRGPEMRRRRRHFQYCLQEESAFGDGVVLPSRTRGAS